jgi:hypothetical protein
VLKGFIVSSVLRCVELVAVEDFVNNKSYFFHHIWRLDLLSNLPPRITSASVSVYTYRLLNVNIIYYYNYFNSSGKSAIATSIYYETIANSELQAAITC